MNIFGTPQSSASQMPGSNGWVGGGPASSLVGGGARSPAAASQAPRPSRCVFVCVCIRVEDIERARECRPENQEQTRVKEIRLVDDRENVKGRECKDLIHDMVLSNTVLPTLLTCVCSRVLVAPRQCSLAQAWEVGAMAWEECQQAWEMLVAWV